MTLTSKTLDPTSFLEIESGGSFMFVGIGHVRAMWSQRSAISVDSSSEMAPRQTWIIVMLAACAAEAPPVADSEPPVVEIEPAVATPQTGNHALQSWMESELLYRVRTKDYPGLVRALEALASVAPSDYPHWAEVATASAQAARDGDLERVRRGCAACHREYRTRYRSTPIEYDIERLIERSRR
jgi:hypothetical protein